MLLVKPTWNSLQIQGSGLNLLALPRDTRLENQEVDEFEILGMEKPELYMQSLEKITYQKQNIPQKIQVIIPLPANKIDKLDNFKIEGIKKEQQVKIVEKVVEKIVEKKETKKVIPNKIIKSDKFQIKGKVRGNNKKITKLETFVIKGREKIDNKKIITLDELFIKGKEKVDRKKIVKSDKFQIKGKEKKIVRNKITKVDKIKIKGLEQEIKEEKLPVENIEESVIDFAIIRKQRKIVPNTIRKMERFRIKGAEKKKVEPNKIRKADRFKINAVKKESNKINNIDRFRYSGKKKEENKINKEDKFVIRGTSKEVKKEEKIIKKRESNKISNIDKFRYSGDKKILMPNQIKKVERFRIIGIPKKEVVQEKEDLFPEYVESLVIKGIPAIKPKPKVIEKVVEKVVEKTKDWNKEIKPIKTTKLILKNSYDKVILPSQNKNIVEEEEEIETVEKVYKNWNNEIKPIKTTKLNIKGTYKPQIVEKIEEKQKEKEKEEFDIENFVINIYDSGKKFRESLQIENAGFDLEGNKGMILKEGPAETIKITKEQILVPSKISQFNLISEQPKKLVEKAEQSVLKNWNDSIELSHANDVTIIQQAPKKEEVVIQEVKKPEIVLKSVKENKLFISGIKPKRIQQTYVEKKKEVNWNKVNTLKRQGSFKILQKKPSKEIKQIEKDIVDWNKFNKIQKKDTINLVNKKITLAKQRTNTFNLISQMEKPQQDLQIIEQRNWTDTLQAQRNAKFGLFGKPKTKKYKLIVANGDKFFIQKESDDEIIYNDDYNRRNDKHKLKAENEDEKKRQIIKEKEIIREKEIIPRLKREIRAQISRLKESESETSSSISEIDVLAGIKRKKTVGYAAASGEAEAALLKYRKTGELGGYQTKIISGEVVFTAKNGLGVNLGGAEYQRRMNGKTGYIKKIGNISSNKMSGIEISMNNPKIKSEVYYQKMSGASGAIADGNYKFIGTKELLDDKGLAGSVSCKQMKVISSGSKTINPEDFGYNGQQQSYRKQVIITSQTETGTHDLNNLNNLNGQSGSTRVIFNNKTVNNNNSGIRKKDSQKSGNSGSSGNSRKIRIKDSPNSGNSSLRVKEITTVSNNNNDLKINQPMNASKVVYSSRIKTENNKNVGQGTNEVSKKEYEMRVQTSGNNNEKIIKKVTEVKIKKDKTEKKVEPLRDYEIQNNF
jgi:hypothetical protein